MTIVSELVMGEIFLRDRKTTQTSTFSSAIPNYDKMEGGEAEINLWNLIKHFRPIKSFDIRWKKMLNLPTSKRARSHGMKKFSFFVDSIA